MNNTPLPTCPKILKWIFVLFNLLFAVLGVLLIALGSWLVVRANAFLQTSGELNDQPVVVTATALGGSGLIIFCGLITFVLAALGVLGGICQARPLLVIFAVGLIIIVVIEFIGAVVVFVAFNRYQDLVGEISSEMNRSLDLYRKDTVNSDANTFVDAVQRNFDCCGISGPNDWIPTPFFRNNNESLPDTCCAGAIDNCNMNSTELHRNGCISAIENLLTTNTTAASVAGALALIILLVEISGIIIAIGLCCCIRSAKLTLV